MIEAQAPYISLHQPTKLLYLAFASNGQSPPTNKHTHLWTNSWLFDHSSQPIATALLTPRCLPSCSKIPHCRNKIKKRKKKTEIMCMRKGLRSKEEKNKKRLNNPNQLSVAMTIMSVYCGIITDWCCLAEPAGNEQWHFQGEGCGVTIRRHDKGSRILPFLRMNSSREREYLFLSVLCSSACYVCVTKEKKSMRVKHT